MKEQYYRTAAQLRHELHAHPELSMQEVWTKAHLMNFLKENTRLDIVDCGRWFYAAFRKKDSTKTIAFRADFDALPIEESDGLCSYISTIPGLGHKCGHDGHSAALAGFALELEEHGADQNVILIFQHAEETGQGALECLPVIEKEQIDEIYAVHNMPGIPLGSIASQAGVVQYASTGMTLWFHGQKSHACYPENGKNPAFAISELVLSLDKLRKRQSYRGMTLITIIEVQVGEHAFGTSAGEGRLLLTVRGEHEEELQDLLKQIEVTASQKAVEQSLTLDISYEDTFADCCNDAAAAEKVNKAADALRFQRAVLPEPFRASEDFGRFTKKVPGAMFYIGDGVDYPPIHTPDFDFPDENIRTISDMYLEILRLS